MILSCGFLYKTRVYCYKENFLLLFIALMVMDLAERFGRKLAVVGSMILGAGVCVGIGQLFPVTKE